MMPALPDLWDKLDDKHVCCRVCERRCVIADGERGACLTRENRDGGLFALTYAAVSSLHVACIEQKPLYHFYPGSSWLSVGSLGCNFRCPGCQNSQIAHASADDAPRLTRHIEPADLVEKAVAEGCKGLSWTYNEPTLWLEYTIDTSRLARKRGLLANYVTNGYITPEALAEVAPLLDAWCVDIKAFDHYTHERLTGVPHFEKVLASAKLAKHTHRLHVECVTNIIPGYTDDIKQMGAIADGIVNTLGPDTPWHVTRFVPHHDMVDVPATPVATLERARTIGREHGLWYVYVGNVAGHPYANTICHACGAVLVERDGNRVVQNRVWQGICPFCSAEIPGQWD